MKKEVYYKCIGLNNNITIWPTHFTIGKKYKQTEKPNHNLELRLSGDDSTYTWSVDVSQFELVK